MEAYRGLEVQLHLFSTLALDERESSASGLRPGRFTSGKELLYQLNKRLGGPHSRSGRFEEGYNLLPFTGFEPRMLQPTAQPLYWLRYTGSSTFI
jgi:hypothetical protein